MAAAGAGNNGTDRGAAFPAAAEPADAGRGEVALAIGVARRRRTAGQQLVGSPPAHPLAGFRTRKLDSRCESYGGLPPVASNGSADHGVQCSGGALEDIERIFSSKLPTWDLMEESFRFHGVEDPVAASCLFADFDKPPEAHTAVSRSAWERVSAWLGTFRNQVAAFDWLLAVASRHDFFGFLTPTDAAFQLRGTGEHGPDRGLWLLRMSSQTGTLTLSCVESSTATHSVNVIHKRLVVTETGNGIDDFAISAVVDEGEQEVPQFSGPNAVQDLIEHGRHVSFFGCGEGETLLVRAVMRPRDLFTSVFDHSRSSVAAAVAAEPDDVLSFSLLELSDHLVKLNISTPAIRLLSEAQWDGSLVPEFCPALLDELKITVFSDRMKLLKLAKETHPRLTWNANRKKN